jgi:hypothetical protein
MFNLEIRQESINCTIRFHFPLQLEHNVSLVSNDKSIDDPNQPDDINGEMRDDDNMSEDENDSMD